MNYYWKKKTKETSRKIRKTTSRGTREYLREVRRFIKCLENKSSRNVERSRQKCQDIRQRTKYLLGLNPRYNA